MSCDECVDRRCWWEACERREDFLTSCARTLLLDFGVTWRSIKSSVFLGLFILLGQDFLSRNFLYEHFTKTWSLRSHESGVANNQCDADLTYCIYTSKQAKPPHIQSQFHSPSSPPFLLEYLPNPVLAPTCIRIYINTRKRLQQDSRADERNR
jgi:hypothetical protein